jgi:type VI secretion system protein ImpL
VLAALLTGAILLFARSLFTVAWHWAARHAPHRDTDRYTRDAAARMDAAKTSSDPAAARRWQDELVHALRDRHGWRWRYRQPWLLLTGNDNTIARLLPELIEHGYLIAEDVVLLWRASGTHGQPDDAWLKQIYTMRRRRPVDGVVLVVDGLADTFAPARHLPGFGVNLARVAQALYWSAPVYVLDVAGVDEIDRGDTPVAGCEFHPRTDAKPIEADLLALRDQLATLGIHRLGANPRDRYTAKLSERLDGRAAPLAGWIAGLATHRVPVRGAFFAPFPSTPATIADAPDIASLPVWPYVGELARRDRGRRAGWHPITVGSVIALALVGLWTSGMLVSAIANADAIHRAQEAVHALDQGDEASRLRALLALQQRIGVYEERVKQHAPGLRGFGLSRDRETRDALWARYATASRALLTAPVQISLENTLAALGKARADALENHDVQQRHYHRLKAYLMLAEPSRTDAAFLATQIATAWPVVTTMPPGEWQDSSQRLARFFADHLTAHPEWRIQPSAPIVTTARAALVTQIGLAHADDTIYQSILDGARGKYTDLSLPSLLNGTDAQGLFTTSATVPGLFTRAAWDGMIAQAIDKAASERHVKGDWVLNNDATTASDDASGTTNVNAAELKQRLTARYFAQYAAAWQHMLNRLRWQPAANLNAAIDQLTRLTDPQTSPLIALMKAVQYQAQAGRPTPAIGDTLVRKAQSLVGKHDDAIQAPIVNPLDPAFGPLLALMGDSGANAPPDRGGPAYAPTAVNGLSLQSYLTAALNMRLKLQQIGNSPDAQTMARSLAQAVFQGKLSDLAQARGQAALTAASLGSAWSGFGDALFARPLEGAWQTIQQPAAASLNDLWRASIAAPFNSAFNGRYPFVESTADASFAELGRYVRPDTGLIARFLTMELAGVLTRQGDQWAPHGLAPRTLAFDPAFLEAVQQTSVLGARLYPSGDAAYRFEIMPQPTPNVTRSELTIDRQRIVYFNQRETWTPIVWPGDGLNGHSALTWKTLDAGAREAFDETGDWAFLRLLAKADIKPLDSARYELTWKQPDTEAIRYVLRAQVGAGPLDLLALRGFKLPDRIFVVGKSGAAPVPPERTAP